jgi:HEPN domain-containing protein
VNLRDKAPELDQSYIPSRFPNAHPASFPGKTFTKTMGDSLINYAQEIVSFCEDKLR